MTLQNAACRALVSFSFAARCHPILVKKNSTDKGIECSPFLFNFTCAKSSKFTITTVSLSKAICGPS